MDNIKKEQGDWDDEEEYKMFWYYFGIGIVIALGVGAIFFAGMYT